jgi:hypothetical protein
MVLISTVYRNTALHNGWQLGDFGVDFVNRNLISCLLQNFLHLINRRDLLRALESLDPPLH